MKNFVFKLFSSCILVAGCNRALIIDGQRWKYYTIPKSMYELIKTYEGCSIQEVIRKEGTDPESLNILSDYFEFLFEHELIFECHSDLVQHFVPIKQIYNHPSTISNAIINIERFIALDLATILVQLTALGCYTLEIRITKPIEHSVLNRLLELCSTFEIDNLSLIVQLNSDTKTLLGFRESFAFLKQIINYNQEFECKEAVGIIFTQKDLSQNTNCGLVRADLFTPTLKHYVESINHNSCLNRKLAIDVNGDIKNCPSMQQNFGNIRDTTLEDAINKPGFQKYWNLTKDHVTKCKDCEFRHICTDCRAYLEKPEDILSAPLKCGYDPYTNEWEEWSTNPLKLKAIKHYQM